MAIGLTSEQLHAIFDDLLVKENDKFKGLFEAETHGEYPTGSKILESLDTNVDRSNLVLIICIANALLETISVNNEAIAKNLPSSQ